MDKMSVLDLLHVLAWATMGILPLGLSAAASSYEGKPEDLNSNPLMVLLSVGFQIAVVVAAYIAGTRA